MMLRVVFLWILCVSLPVGYGRFLMLVNRVIWLSADDPKVNLNAINGRTFYHYIDGDNIDVSCVNLGEIQQRRVKLYFDGISKHHVRHDISDIGKLSFKSGVGLRTTLRTAHDNSNMSCIFSDDTSKATMNITFILEKTYNDILDLKINGLLTRRSNLKMGAKVRYDILYIDIERFSFECHFSRNDTVLTAQLYTRGSRTSSHEPVIKIMPTGNDLIYYEVVNKTTKNKHLIIEIHFQRVPDFISNYLLTLNVSENRGLYHWYGFNGVQLIYLEYEDGDNLTMNCNTGYTRVELMPQKDFYLNFSGSDTQPSQPRRILIDLIARLDRSSGYLRPLTYKLPWTLTTAGIHGVPCFSTNDVKRNSSSIIKTVRLTPEDDNETQECSLYYKENMASLIQVMFYRVSIDENLKLQYWIPAVAAGCLCVVLVVASNVTCYIRSRKRQVRKVTSSTSSGRLEDPRRDNNDSVVLCAAQLEAQYSVPMRMKPKDTTVSDLQQRNLGYTPYATIQASASRTKDSSSDPNYAVPDKSDRR